MDGPAVPLHHAGLPVDVSWVAQLTELGLTEAQAARALEMSAAQGVAAAADWHFTHGEEDVQTTRGPQIPTRSPVHHARTPSGDLLGLMD